MPENKKSTLALPPSIRSHRLRWLLGGLWQRPHSYNKMFSAVACGEPGSGKSWLTLSLAEALDRDNNDKPRFDIGRVCFTASEFASCVSKDWPVGTVIVFDDSGLALYSREAMQKDVRAIAKIFQACRYRRLIILLSLPSLAMLDKTVRSLINTYIQPEKILYDVQQTRAKWQWLSANPRTGKLYSRRPTRRVKHVYYDGLQSFKTQTIDSVLFDRPSVSLAEQYEATKKHHMDDWLVKTAAEISERERGPLYSKKRYALPPEVRQTVREMRAKGYSYPRIAKECSIARSTARKYAGEAAVVANKADNPPLT
jgi:hypothetical protein